MKLFNKKRPAFTADRLLKPLRLKGGDFVFQLTVRDARFALLAHRKLFFADFHFVSRPPCFVYISDGKFCQDRGTIPRQSRPFKSPGR